MDGKQKCSIQTRVHWYLGWKHIDIQNSIDSN